MPTADHHRIEVVRGQLTDERAEQILGFWSRHGALEGEAARKRLAEVVCVLVDADGEVSGVNSVYDAPVPLVGGRRFWLYRRFAPGIPEAYDAGMLVAAYDVLAGEFERSGDGPVGLCLLVAEPELMRRRPEAVWPETEMLYAGYQPDGQQVRIRYFEGAKIA